MNPGGVDESDLRTGNWESIDEDLGRKTRLEVDFERGLGERRLARARAQQLDHSRYLDRRPATAEGNRESHGRDDDQTKGGIEETVRNVHQATVRAMRRSRPG